MELRLRVLLLHAVTVVITLSCGQINEEVLQAGGEIMHIGIVQKRVAIYSKLY